jgi:hypothetical protein
MEARRISCFHAATVSSLSAPRMTNLKTIRQTTQLARLRRSAFSEPATKNISLQIQCAKKSWISAAMSLAWVSSAKRPVSKKWTIAPGISRLNASAPRGRKNGSFFPQTARKRGL